MPPDDALTDHEVRRGFARLEDALTTLTQTVTTIAHRDAADYERFQAIDARLRRLESWQTWTLRIIVAAVGAAALALVVRLPG